MNEIKFLVQGSSSDPYSVIFSRQDDGELNATCNCRAALSKKHCKHRVEILEGNCAGVVSGNADDVALVAQWLQGTVLESTLLQHSEVEQRLELAKKELKAIKAKLSRVMAV